jgi:formylglycine-generating enzyme required for sulfatase activity
LARIEAPSGTLIHYATRPGSVAEDGKGAHGTYTAALLAQMTQEAVPVEQTLKQVTVQVKNATKGKQVPWMEGSLTGEFYFVLKGPTQITIHQVPADADGAAWQAAEAGGTAAAYEAYLNEFPNGLYASAARVKLANLAAGKGTAKRTPADKRSDFSRTIRIERQDGAAERTPADERSDPDMALWKEVRGSGSREDYETYLNEFPRGKYAALAHTELKSLAAKEKEERAEGDRQAWKTAKQINTQDSYDAYLAVHPTGIFAAQAQRARDKAKAAARSQLAQNAAAEEKNRTQGTKARQSAESPPKTKQEELREAALRELSMARLSAAEFVMGAAADDTSDSPDTDEQARPQHQVRIGEFELGYYEVTVGQFRRFVEATGYRTEAERPGPNAGCHAPQRDGSVALREGATWRQPGFPQDDNHPVVCVSWNDVQRFVAWLNGATPSFRLPSEAEWEYAARAGTATGRPWSDAGGFFSRLFSYGQKPEDTPARPTHQACKYANIADKRIASQLQWTAVHDCDDGYVFTVPGGYFKRNNFSLNDMIGNVAEWTQDCWSPNYRGAPDDGRPWMSGDCSQHVLRGGSWSASPIYARSAARNKNLASYRATDLGFRLARNKQP